MDIAQKVLQLKDDFDKVFKAGEGGLWDMIQDYGNRNDYEYAFFGWAAVEYIRPKYKVIPTALNGVMSMFQGCVALKRIEGNYFDLSQKVSGENMNTGYRSTFNSCSKLEVIEDIGMIPQCYYHSTFSYCYKLHTIAKIGVNENTMFYNAFMSCSALENITIDGTIGQNGFDIHWSTKLTAKSLYSIVDALSKTTTGLTITLPTTAEANYNAYPPENAPATWAELVATKNNWTIAYA